MNSATESLAVFINGRAASGKTHLCHLLGRAGFEVISASSIFAQYCRLHDIFVSSRADLNRAGVELAALEHHSNGFAKHLYSEAKSRFVVYDGIRISASLFHLKTLFPTCFSIYLDTASDIRRRRHAMRGGSIIEFDEEEINETLMGDSCIRASADLLVDARSVEIFGSFIGSLVLTATRT